MMGKGNNMMATKNMISSEILSEFRQIQEYAKRSGMTMAYTLDEVDRIEKILMRIKWLSKEYEIAPSNWVDEYSESSESLDGEIVNA